VTRPRGPVPEPRRLVRDVLLRDGSTLRLQTPTPVDYDDTKAFYDGLSPESRYLILRFALLLLEFPEVVEADLNPVRCMDDKRLRRARHTTTNRAPTPNRARQNRWNPRARTSFPAQAWGRVR
jgi:hypothetical protein